ncbi:hypothetical protein [Noviherbaspirillum album]|uniref:hypothetical protein n=1 Tax=Noviherbaspirillum album TaxID=3080276 RepID=UPI002DD649FD|nr:hypothetical protein [Noviherbaspirillum sp. CPCC 100848]
MKAVFKVVGLLAWLVLLLFCYGAIWNRNPEGFFPVPPEPVNNWIASRLLAGFNIEDKTDILVLSYSFVVSCCITLCIWLVFRLWKRIR